ncbi:hypothetical protein F4558_000345 [Micromonospora profundi]|nr:hypothetical protein [Micromonospora profundi]
MDQNRQERNNCIGGKLLGEFCARLDLPQYLRNINRATLQL